MALPGDRLQDLMGLLREEFGHFPALHEFDRYIGFAFDSEGPREAWRQASKLNQAPWDDIRTLISICCRGLDGTDGLEGISELEGYLVKATESLEAGRPPEPHSAKITLEGPGDWLVKLSSTKIKLGQLLLVLVLFISAMIVALNATSLGSNLPSHFSETPINRINWSYADYTEDPQFQFGLNSTWEDESFKTGNASAITWQTVVPDIDTTPAFETFDLDTEIKQGDDDLNKVDRIFEGMKDVYVPLDDLAESLVSNKNQIDKGARIVALTTFLAGGTKYIYDSFVRPGANVIGPAAQIALAMGEAAVSYYVVNYLYEVSVQVVSTVGSDIFVVEAPHPFKGASTILAYDSYGRRHKIVTESDKTALMANLERMAENYSTRVKVDDQEYRLWRAKGSTEIIYQMVPSSADFTGPVTDVRQPVSLGLWKRAKRFSSYGGPIEEIEQNGLASVNLYFRDASRSEINECSKYFERTHASSFRGHYSYQFKIDMSRLTYPVSSRFTDHPDASKVRESLEGIEKKLFQLLRHHVGKPDTLALRRSIVINAERLLSTAKRISGIFHASMAPKELDLTDEIKSVIKTIKLSDEKKTLLSDKDSGIALKALNDIRQDISKTSESAEFVRNTLFSVETTDLYLDPESRNLAATILDRFSLLDKLSRDNKRTDILNLKDIEVAPEVISKLKSANVLIERGFGKILGKILKGVSTNQYPRPQPYEVEDLTDSETVLSYFKTASTALSYNEAEGSRFFREGNWGTLSPHNAVWSLKDVASSIMRGGLWGIKPADLELGRSSNLHYYNLGYRCLTRVSLDTVINQLEASIFDMMRLFIYTKKPTVAELQEFYYSLDPERGIGGLTWFYESLKMNAKKIDVPIKEITPVIDLFKKDPTKFSYYDVVVAANDIHQRTASDLRCPLERFLESEFGISIRTNLKSPKLARWAMETVGRSDVVRSMMRFNELLGVRGNQKTFREDFFDLMEERRISSRDQLVLVSWLTSGSHTEQDISAAANQFKSLVSLRSFTATPSREMIETYPELIKKLGETRANEFLRQIGERSFYLPESGTSSRVSQEAVVRMFLRGTNGTAPIFPTVSSNDTASSLAEYAAKLSHSLRAAEARSTVFTFDAAATYSRLIPVMALVMGQIPLLTKLGSRVEVEGFSAKMAMLMGIYGGLVRYQAGKPEHRLRIAAKFVNFVIFQFFGSNALTVGLTAVMEMFGLPSDAGKTLTRPLFLPHPTSFSSTNEAALAVRLLTEDVFDLAAPWIRYQEIIRDLPGLLEGRETDMGPYNIMTSFYQKDAERFVDIKKCITTLKEGIASEFMTDNRPASSLWPAFSWEVGVTDTKLFNNLNGSFTDMFFSMCKTMLGKGISDDKILADAIESCTSGRTVLKSETSIVNSIFFRPGARNPSTELRDETQLQSDGKRLDMILTLDPKTRDEVFIKIEMIMLFLTKRTHSIEPVTVGSPKYWTLKLPTPLELTKEALDEMFENSSDHTGASIEETDIAIKQGIARLRFMWEACRASEKLGAMLYETIDKRGSVPSIDGFAYVLNGTLSFSALKDSTSSSPGLGEYIRRLSEPRMRVHFFDNEQLIKEAFFLFLTDSSHPRRYELAVALRTYQLFTLLLSEGSTGRAYGGVFLKEEPQVVKERYIRTFNGRTGRNTAKGDRLDIQNLARMASTF